VGCVKVVEGICVGLGDECLVGVCGVFHCGRGCGRMEGYGGCCWGSGGLRGELDGDRIGDLLGGTVDSEG